MKADLSLIGRHLTGITPQETFVAVPPAPTFGALTPVGRGNAKAGRQRWDAVSCCVGFVRQDEGIEQCLDGCKRGPIGQDVDVEIQADFYILLRQIIRVDQHLADLVGVVGIFALFGVVILEQELLGAFVTA
ncbi:MAG: hypothetical protein Q8O25_11040 [Sulfurisoma sp.]|nr:hypothetical protein [Sulfurisoma sp.]